jgi:hypothetical protein
MCQFYRPYPIIEMCKFYRPYRIIYRCVNIRHALDLSATDKLFFYASNLGQLAKIFLNSLDVSSYAKFLAAPSPWISECLQL